MFWDEFGRRGEAVALRYRAQTSGFEALSYADLAAACDAFQARLPLRKSMVLVSVDNSPGCIAAMFGALRGGHVVMLADAGDSALQANLRTNFAPDYLYRSGPAGWELEAVPGGRSYELDPELAMVISTSGSTGSAKCVRISRQNLQANTTSIYEYLGVRSEDRAALILPLHYCYGLSVLNTHLASGACTYLGLRVASGDFAETLTTERIASFAGVPYTFNILEKAGFRTGRYPHLRYITQAGGRLDRKLVQTYDAWSRHSGSQFFVMYGQTEATARMAYMPPDRLADCPNCIGRAIPGGTLELHDDRGQVIEAAGVSGELVYRGPNVMMGYAYQGSDLALPADTAYLKTGDVACRNSEGLYYIVGRLKRFAKIYGKRFNLDEIERYLRSFGVEVACVSDDANLYLAAEAEGLDGYADQVNARFGIDTGNIRTKTFSAMPLLSSGKIDYASLLKVFQAELREEEERKAGQRAPTDPVKAIKEIYKASLKLDDVNGDQTFARLGGDSLRYVRVSIELEKVLGHIPPNWENTSIDDLGKTSVSRTSKFFLPVETSIVLRIYAILAVVLNHAGLEVFRGGAWLLMVIAGLNFSRFQFDRSLVDGPSRSVVPILRNVLVPAWLVLVGYGLIKGYGVDVSELLLYANFLPDRPREVAFETWFVQSLIQSILVVSGPLAVPAVRRWATDEPLQYTVLVFAGAFALRLVDGGLNLSNALHLDGSQLSWSMWMFCLGMLIRHASQLRVRLALTAFVPAASLVLSSSDTSRMVTLTAGTLILIWCETLAVPELLIPALTTIGSASLFIYMLHGRAPIDSFTADWPVDVIRVAYGVMLGVVAWKLYSLIDQRIGAIGKESEGDLVPTAQ